MNKDVAELVKILHSNGLETGYSGAGHVTIHDPQQGGRRVYSIPSTPSSRKWRKNALSDLRRLGLLDRTQTKRDAGGQAPPPLPELNWKEDSMPIGEYSIEGAAFSSGVPRNFVAVNSRMIEEGCLLFNEIATEYGLKPRGNRITGHGSAPVLAQVMMAWEQETGKEIPSFNYVTRSRDHDKRASLAANRASEFAATYKPGTHVSPVTVATLEYALEAWDWFKSINYEFPDGRKIYMHGQGLKVDLPVAVAEVKTAPEVEVDPWSALAAEIGQAYPQTDAFVLPDTPDLPEGEPLLVGIGPAGAMVEEAVFERPLENLNGYVSLARADLAMRVAAAVTADYETAVALAREVLTVN